MNRFNFLKAGLYLGLTPIIVLCFLLFIFWIGRTLFAIDIDVTGIGFLIIIVSIPIVLIGFLLTFISLFKRKGNSIIHSIIGLLVILANAPLLLWTLRTHGEISSRAYLKVINNSDNDIASITIIEPDKERQFGSIKKQSSTIIYYYPDYYSKDGMSYPGISLNYLFVTTNNNKLKRKIPIIHPGEIHQLSLDSQLNISDIHLNKVTFNK